MATYLVDASVVIQYLITQAYTPEARVLVTRLYQGEQLYIPEFCLDCPLITVDDRQSNGAIASGVTLKPITDFSLVE